MGEYILTEDTAAILGEVYPAVNPDVNEIYLGRVAMALRSATNLESEVTVFTEETIEEELESRVREVLSADKQASAVVLDRFLCRKLETDPIFKGRVNRLSITRSYGGEKIPRPGNKEIDDQVDELAERIQVAGLDAETIYLVDDGFFTGGTVQEIVGRLAAKGMGVKGAIGFIKNGLAELAETELIASRSIEQLDEWIDIRDFTPFGGKIYETSKRGNLGTIIPYLAPWSKGEAASLNMLPEFFRVSIDMLDAQTNLYEQYAKQYGDLTIKDMIRAGYAIPTDADKNIPVTLDTVITDYIKQCRQLVQLEKQREVVVLDMDGTLYDLVSADGEPGFEGSKLKQRVDANAVTFIATLVDSDAVDVVYEEASRDEVGISAYLEKNYGVLREDFFKIVWDIDPSGLINRNADVERLVKELGGGNFGSYKVKPILVTAAPAIWKDRVLGLLGISDVFEDVYSGEMYDSKRQVFEILAGRYDPSKVTSIGDQEWSDILPATCLGLNGVLVEGPVGTVNALSEVCSA